MTTRIATVFGGTGFLGHAVVQALAARGYQVRVPTRDLDKANDLKLLGAVGQIVPIHANLKTDAAALDLVTGSEVVINLIGEMFETKGETFQAAHVEKAARIARAAKAAQVPRLIHVSALGAHMTASARYARTKAVGEEAVRAFYPAAVILRPSLMFGPRDRFFNMFAVVARYCPFLPLIGGGLTRFQPIYVGDVAQAIMVLLDRPTITGRTFLLGGPTVYSFRELLDMICQVTRRKRWLVPLSWEIAMVKAWFWEKLSIPLLTRDQVELLKTDNVVPQYSFAPNVWQGPEGTLDHLGITPTPLEEILPRYLV